MYPQEVLPRRVLAMGDDMPRRDERRQVIVLRLCQVSTHDDDLHQHELSEIEC